MNKNEAYPDRLEMAAKILRGKLTFQARNAVESPVAWAGEISPDSVVNFTRPNDWYKYEIRIKPAATKVPLEPEDIPPGSVFRHTCSSDYVWATPMTVHGGGVRLNGTEYSYDNLESNFLIKRPGQDWQPCYKEIP